MVPLGILYKVMANKLNKLPIVDEFDSHWVSHISGLINNIYSALN